jgi:hypothetical protein
MTCTWTTLPLHLHMSLHLQPFKKIPFKFSVVPTPATHSFTVRYKNSETRQYAICITTTLFHFYPFLAYINCLSKALVYFKLFYCQIQVVTYKMSEAYENTLSEVYNLV